MFVYDTKFTYLRIKVLQFSLIIKRRQSINNLPMENNSPPFDVEQFIKEVKIRPVLWDGKDPNFNHRQAKTSAWEEVALNLYPDSENWSNYDKFGKVRDIQKRWKNMRDTYVKELRYERRVQQGLAVAKRKRYVYADLMDFLTPRKKPPSKSSSDKSSSEDNEEMDAETNNKTSDSYMMMDEGYSSSHVNQFCKVMFDSQPEHHSSRNSLEPTTKADIPAQKSITSPNSRPGYTSAQFSFRNFPDSQTRSDHGIPNMANKSIQITETPSSRIVPSVDLNYDSTSIPLEQDDDKMFLLSLLPFFKKFTEERKLQVRINVTQLLQNMLYKE